MTCSVVTGSAAETLDVAQRLGVLLRPGDVVVLAGELGAGKTVFAKGIALALGITATVSSPTFTIVREYDAPLPLVHVDVYRLDHLQELHDLGLDDVLGGDGVMVVEWGDKVASALPVERLDVHIAAGPGDDDRVITLECTGPSWAARRDAIDAVVDGGNGDSAPAPGAAPDSGPEH